MQTDVTEPSAVWARRRLDGALCERVLAAHPLPVADALGALLAADSVFEERDRVVEVFRVTLRLLAAMTLAARLQLGPGPGGEAPQLPELLRVLRSRGLTDGQWMALLREGLRSWSGAREGFPLPELVALMHGRKAELPKLFNELLVMRKSETVAHGATGTRAAIEAILDKRVPQLARTLELLDPLWSRVSLCLPLAPPGEGPQAAWLLMGTTPHRGRFRKTELAGTRLAAGEASWIDRDARPLIALHPIGLFRRPSPDAVEELFLLDGGTKRGALYVAFPSMSEHREADAWATIEGALSDDEAPQPDGEAPSAAPAGRPYRGLASFGPEDAALFFGREEQAEALANRVRRHGMITLTGPSGSGKSSLLRAGVLPLLRDATTTFVRPGVDALGSLTAKLAETLAGAASRPGEALPSSSSALGAELRELEPSALARRVEQAAREAEKLHVIVIDQGEELLTLTADAEARERFGRVLVALASGEGSTRVVLGVREDFFGRLATVPSLRELYSRQVEVVTTPDRPALIRTLIAPAQAFGYVFEDEELITTMVDAVADAPAALALLQFCADRLWDHRDRKWRRLTWDAYRGLGGVAGALAQHADEVLASLSAAERVACRSVLLRLVSGERTRAVVLREELLDGLADPDRGARVLDALIAARLVSATEDASGGTTIEIVHEALIKHWEVLDRWLGEDEEGQRLAHAMRLAAREWHGRGRPRDLVWRGDLLDELRRYRSRAAEPLVGLEAAFADASEQEARRGRRLRAGLIVGALVVSSGFSVFAGWQWQKSEAARLETEEQRQATAREKVNAEIRGLVAEARSHDSAGRSGHALALLRAASRLENEQGANGATAVSFEVERLAHDRAGGRVLAGHTAGLHEACVPPGADRVVTTSLDETVRIWELSTGRLLHTSPPQGGPIHQLACLPDGKRFVTGGSSDLGSSGRVSVWSVATGTEERKLADLPKLDWMELTADGSRLFTMTTDGHLRLHDVASGALVASLAHETEIVYEADATADGKHVVLVFERRVDIWSPDEGQPARSYEAATMIATAALSDDGTRVAWGGREDGAVSLVDVPSGETIASLKPAGTLGVASVGFAPGGRILVTSGPRGFDLWDARTGLHQGHLLGEPAQTSFQFSPAGDRLVTKQNGGRSAVLWDVATRAQLAHFGGHDDSIEAIAFSSDGATLVTGSADRTARVQETGFEPLLHFWTGASKHWAVSRDGLRVATIDEELRFTPTAGEGLSPAGGVAIRPENWSESAIRGATFSADGKELLVGLDRAVELRDGESGALVRRILLEDPLAAVALSDDGRIGVGTTNGKVLMIAREGTTEHTLPLGDDASVAHVVFAPKGELLAVAGEDKRVRVLRATTGETVRELEDTIGAPADLAFSPDGTSLAIADQERVRWFDTTSWSVEELRDHKRPVRTIAFSPDGAALATGSVDHAIFLRRRGADPVPLVGHTGAVIQLAFAPDGGRLVSVDERGSVRLWNLSLRSSFEIGAPFGGYRVDGARFLDAERILLIGRGQDASVAIVKTPPADRARTLLATGTATNLRVCRATFAVVPIMPPPPPDEVWAPDDRCR